MILEKKYAEFADIGWFVKGTNYRSITYHEIGHMFSNTHNVDGLRLSQDALGLVKWVDISELLETTLSQYAVSYDNGIEILPEVFASYFCETSSRSEVLLKLFNKTMTIKQE